MKIAGELDREQLGMESSRPPDPASSGASHQGLYSLGRGEGRVSEAPAAVCESQELSLARGLGRK